jgi:hypothetical protein
VSHLHNVQDISVVTSYTTSLRSEKEHINSVHLEAVSPLSAFPHSYQLLLIHWPGLA